MRHLTLVPIVHSDADLGRLAGEVWRRKAELLGEEGAHASRTRVARYWEALETTLFDRFESFRDVHLYQDGLPIAEGVQRRIVEDLAEQGSENHRLLLRMLDSGAILCGTESPELLVQEYQRVQALLSGEEDSSQGGDSGARELVEKRDRFIADRIDATLPANGRGLLLIGMLHDVAPFLADDIRAESVAPNEFVDH